MERRLRNAWRRLGLGCMTLLVCLLLAPGAARAGNLVVRVNGNQVSGQQATLGAAVEASGVALGSVTRLEITGGNFMAADWLWLRDNRGSLSELADFTIAESVQSAGIFRTLMVIIPTSGVRSSG